MSGQYVLMNEHRWVSELQVYAEHFLHSQHSPACHSAPSPCSGMGGGKGKNGWLPVLPQGISSSR